MQTPTPEHAREKLTEWQREQRRLGLFLAVGGGTYCSMRVRVKTVAKHLATLRGEAANVALWINDARFEHGPVDLFLSPTPPPKQVTGVSIYLKKGGWAFLFELSEKEHSWFELENELSRRAITAGEENEEEEEEEEMTTFRG